MAFNATLKATGPKPEMYFKVSAYSKGEMMSHR